MARSCASGYGPWAATPRSDFRRPRAAHAFPHELCQEATETRIDPEQRRIFGRMMRAHRGLLAMQIRHVAEKIERLDQEIGKCDQLIVPLDPDPDMEV